MIQNVEALKWVRRLCRTPCTINQHVSMVHLNCSAIIFHAYRCVGTSYSLGGGGGGGGGHEPKTYVISQDTMNGVCVGELNIWGE